MEESELKEEERRQKILSKQRTSEERRKELRQKQIAALKRHKELFTIRNEMTKMNSEHKQRQDELRIEEIEKRKLRKKTKGILISTEENQIVFRLG